MRREIYFLLAALTLSAPAHAQTAAQPVSFGIVGIVNGVDNVRVNAVMATPPEPELPCPVTFQFLDAEGNANCPGLCFRFGWVLLQHLFYGLRQVLLTFFRFCFLIQSLGANSAKNRLLLGDVVKIELQRADIQRARRGCGRG